MMEVQDSYTYLCNLRDIRETLTRRRPVVIEGQHDLVFLHPPSSDSILPTMHNALDSSPQLMNTGQLALVWNAPDNSPVLTYEEWLYKALGDVEQASSCGYSEVILHAKAIRTALETAIEELAQWKATQWERQQWAALASMKTLNGSDLDYDVDTSHLTVPLVQQQRPRLLLLLLLAATLHLFCGLSIDHSIFLMSALKMIISLSEDGTSMNLHNIDSQALPGDIRGVVAALQLDPKTDHFVCCPACFALYPHDKDNQFPLNCTHTRAGNLEQCGADLYVTRRVKAKTKKYPCRKFVRHDFEDWFGKMLHRPGMESMMDKCVERASTTTLTDRASDIWEAPALHTITLPDGRPFICVKSDEGRYVFSICIDGFNPGGKGAPSASVGSIFFACLNLPPDLRYKPENMYLAGVIPGPHHPAKEELNHILENVLEPFRHAYQKGIRYTHTPSQPQGRRAFVIVLPLVADTLAAQQMNGNAPHTHTHFCPFCKITIHDIQNLDYARWTKRVCKAHISTARAWLKADDSEKRDLIYNATGVRWSALFTLPYWDAVRHIAIDPMHLFYLGLFHHHCRKVWGMDSEEADGLDGITVNKKNDPTPEEMSIAYELLHHGTATQLRALRVRLLQKLAEEQGVEGWAQKNKESLYRSLQELVRALQHDISAKQEFTRRQRSKNGWKSQPVEKPVPAPKVDDEDTPSVKQVLEDVKTSSIKSLAKHPVRTLAAACRRMFGGSGPSYESKSRDELLELIKALRKKLNIVDEEVTPPTRQTQRRLGHEDADISDEQYSDVLAILKAGTKTELHKLLVPALAALCYREIGTSRQQVKRSRDEFIRIVHKYRIDHKITDEQGKLLVPRHDEIMPDDEELAVVGDTIHTGSRAKILKLRIIALATWCAKTLGVQVSNTKVAVMPVIDQYRAQKGITGEHGKVITETIPTRTYILGRNTLGRIWSDMATLRTPSWLTKAPARAGAAGAGGLGADEWRTFCTINLTVTLVSMWGLKPKGSRERALLDNFMDLVTAVTLASKRVTTQERRQQYQTYMHRYLTTLLELFPATKLVSNQHKALHFADVLEFLGPAHVLWCYGFERGNYELQQINSNNRIYDIPETLSRRFCQKQNLRYIFSKASLPPVFHNLVDSFHRSFGRGNQRGTLQHEMKGTDSDPVINELIEEIPDLIEEIPGVGHDDQLSDEVRQALQERVATDCTRSLVKRLKAVTLRGDVYKPEATSPGDSYVKFTIAGDSDWRAGSIQDIFVHRCKTDTGEFCEKTWIVVEEFIPLSTSVKDPYKEYLAAGRLFNPQYEQKSRLLLPEEVQSHCALSSPFIDGMEDGGQYIHVLPLDKVCDVFIICNGCD